MFRNLLTLAMVVLITPLILLPIAATPGTYGQRVVAGVLLAEARGEGERAMTAVAEVIRTRADLAGVSPLEVVTKKGAFSCLNRKDPAALVKRFQGHELWSRALEISRTMYNQPDRLPGISRKATHFHSGKKVDWAKKHRPVAVVGDLKFYRLPYKH